MKSELYKIYKEKVIPALIKEFGYKNSLQVPKISKVVINVGYGRQAKDKKFIDGVELTLRLISGQKPVHNKARKSISNFKVRQGMNIGASVTLRGDRMYDFLYKLINLTLPRVRDFRGLNPKSVDKNGNFTIGFKENLSFPEVSDEAQDILHGLEVVINTTANNREEGYALLDKLGFPFKKIKKNNK